MKIYYIGELIQPDFSDGHSIFKATLRDNNFYTDNTAKHIIESNSQDYDYFKQNIKKWKNKYAGINDKKLESILSNSFKFLYTRNYYGEEIIYEIIEDKDGFLYGKELITGLLFPILNNTNDKYIYFEDGFSERLDKVITYTNKNMARIGCTIENKEVASINRINEYIIEATGESKKDKNKRKKFEEELRLRYNENVFKNEIIEKKKEEPKEQSEINKLMENVEYVLCSLKQYNWNLYSKYNKVYKETCDKYLNTQNLINYDYLKKELSDLMLSIKLNLIMCKYSCTNVLDYLNIIISEYLTNFESNKTNVNPDVKNININEIDKITEMFLTDKESYNFQMQRDILRKISLLYLLVIKNNIDKYTLEQLENSYFKDNLKSIVLNIDALKDTNIITNKQDLDLNENLSISKVLEIIKNIKFNIKEENKSKIKQI